MNAPAQWMVLFRHGHSEWNLSDRFTGWADIPLTETGLAEAAAAGRRLLVVSHGNTLRGLVMYLDGLSAEAMERVEIPSGVPLIYRLTPDLRAAGHAWLDVPASVPT